MKKVTISYETEDQMTVDVFTEVRNKFPQTRGLFFHVPNEMNFPTGTTPTARLRIINKRHAMGVVEGVPDFIFLWRSKCYGIELKLPNGKISPSQRRLHLFWVQDGSVPVFICWDLESVLFVISGIIDESLNNHLDFFAPPYNVKNSSFIKQ